jgi:hypothetical protein
MKKILLLPIKLALYTFNFALIASVLFVIDPDTAFFLENVIIPLVK